MPGGIKWVKKEKKGFKMIAALDSLRVLTTCLTIV